MTTRHDEEHDESRDDRLFELQETLAAALDAGEAIEDAALAERFELSLEDVAACRRAALLLGAGDPLGAEQPAAPPPLPDDYELLGELGRGGMGVVYRVRQRSLNREVALKLVRGDALTDRERVAARFQREASSLARLRHPGVVAIHEVGRAGEHLYYTMDLIDGRDLAERLRDRPLSPSQAVELITQVADAVAHAHRQGVLHRDLKPANVLVDDAGRAFVVDFGIARELLGERSHRTATGELLGTPTAMSPEQARGDHDAISERTDVHGLGLLLFWCLTGHPPFESTALPVLLREISEQEAPRADALRRSVPRDLATICAKALAKRPDDRYPTAAAFADDLRRFAAGEPIAARARGPGAKLLRALRRHAVLLGSLAAALTITVAVVWSTVLPSARRDDRLALARVLRDRGEVGAAATLLDELHHETDDPRVTRAWVQSLLDSAEMRPRVGATDAAPDDPLHRAADEIARYYRVSSFGGGRATSARQAATSWERASALAEDPSEESAARDAIAPWSVLQLRQATLAGDLEAVAKGFNQLAMFGDYDQAVDWLATARQRDDHPAHGSAVGMLALQVLPHDYPCSDSLERGQVAVDPWVELAKTRDRQAPQLAALLDAVMRDPNLLRRSEWAPGEAAIDALAAQIGDGTEPTATSLAPHLLAHAIGLPGSLPETPTGRTALTADLLRYATDPGLPPAERLRRRIDLLLTHWPDGTEDDAWQQSFTDLTGAEAPDRTAARAWWAARRDTAPHIWLARSLGLDPDTLDAAQALSRLGAADADGVALRRAHDLLSLVATRDGALRGPAPKWNAGGVASAPDQAAAPRRALIAAWTRALRADQNAAYRLRLAVALFEGASPQPRIVARHSIELGLGEAVDIDAYLPGVLPHDAFTPSVDQAGGDVWGRSSHHGSAVHFRVTGELVPGSHGAAARLRDESRLLLASRVESRQSLQGEILVGAGTVASLSYLSGDLPWRGWREVDALVLATVEPVTDSDRPWPAEQWRSRLATGIAQQLADDPHRGPNEQILDDGVLEAAAWLPAPEVRGLLRAQIPLRENTNRRTLSGDLARALLLAGDSAAELDNAADIYLDYSRFRSLATLCFWTRLAGSTKDSAIRGRALQHMVPPESSNLVPSDLSVGLANSMRRVVASLPAPDAEVPEALTRLLDDAPSASLYWWLRRAGLSLMMGPLLFGLWLLGLLNLWRPARPRAMRDDFAMRCVMIIYFSGIALLHPMLLGGTWLVLVDWQLLAIACVAILLAARRQERRPAPWRQMLGGMIALTIALLILRATGYNAWLDDHILWVRGAGIALALRGALGLDFTPQRVRPPSAALLRRRAALTR